jgi:hypothetical protein|tara:strand:- start:462 stop:656 length:195 start_codon:yes stop_codon:yes gene_type:complete
MLIPPNNDFLDNLGAQQHEKMLREVVGDAKHDFKRQNKLHEEIRNDDDYDDWEYGTEPIIGESA